MSKRKIGLIILLLVIVGAYASFYAYESTVIGPENMETFKSDLNATSEPVLTESELKNMDSLATEIENGNYLASMSPSERTQMANELRQETAPVKSQLQGIKENFTESRDAATDYDLMLKGDVANNIRTAYSENITSTADQIISVSDKMATDLQNGDSAAFAADIKKFDSLVRQFNSEMAQSHAALEQVVNALGG